MEKYTIDEQKKMWNLVMELPILYATQTSPIDIMGELFNNLNMSNARIGQFFTPSHISDAIAYMGGMDEDLIKNLGYIPMAEPSCRFRSNDFVCGKRINKARLRTFKKSTCTSLGYR